MKRTLIIALSVVALVFGVISYATAAPGDQTGKVTVNASVNSALSLTLDDAEVDMGLLEPGVVSGAKTLGLKYSTNWANTQLSAAVTSNAPAHITVNSALSKPLTNLDRGKSIAVNDSITALVDYEVDPEATTELGTILYTLAVK